MSSGKEGFFVATLSPGMLLFITGTMRSGKTNLTINIMKRGIDKFYHIYTNIHFFKEDEIEEAKREGLLNPNKEYEQKHQNIHLVTSASELIKGLCNTRKNIIVLDEGAIFAGSGRGNAKIVRWFKELVTQMGKFKASMILITQVKSEMAVMLKKKLPTHEIKVYKISKKNRYAEIFFILPQINEEAENAFPLDKWKLLEEAVYPFDTEAPAMFNFDIDMEDFLIRISRLNSIETRKEASSIIDEMLNEGKKKYNNGELTAKEMIQDKIKLYPDETNDAIGALCGRTGQYVWKIRKDMKEKS